MSTGYGAFLYIASKGIIIEEYSQGLFVKSPFPKRLNSNAFEEGRTYLSLYNNTDVR